MDWLTNWIDWLRIPVLYSLQPLSMFSRSTKLLLVNWRDHILCPGILSKWPNWANNGYSDVCKAMYNGTMAWCKEMRCYKSTGQSRRTHTWAQNWTNTNSLLRPVCNTKKIQAILWMIYGLSFLQIQVNNNTCTHVTHTHSHATVQLHSSALTRPELSQHRSWITHGVDDTQGSPAPKHWRCSREVVCDHLRLLKNS